VTHSTSQRAQTPRVDQRPSTARTRASDTTQPPRPNTRSRRAAGLVSLFAVSGQTRSPRPATAPTLATDLAGALRYARLRPRPPPRAPRRRGRAALPRLRLRDRPQGACPGPPAASSLCLPRDPARSDHLASRRIWTSSTV
jgi:hypothetical protein